MFAAVKAETDRADAALVAAALFAFMPYHVTLVYVRGDLAEYGAVSGAVRDLGVPHARASRAARYAPLRALAAGTHAATLLVHTLTGQWLTEFLALIVGWTAWRSHRAGDRGRALALGRPSCAPAD